VFMPEMGWRKGACDSPKSSGAGASVVKARRKLPAVGVAGAESSGIFNAFAGYVRPSEAGNI
jgi:hypothetical protein